MILCAPSGTENLFNKLIDIFEKFYQEICRDFAIITIIFTIAYAA